MEKIRLIDAFKWGTSPYDVPLVRRLRRNFFFYALVRSDPSAVSEIGNDAPAMPEYLARFITAFPAVTVNCTMLDRMYFIHSRNKYIISLYEDIFREIREGSSPNIDDYIVGNNALYGICPVIYAEKEKKWKEISDTYFYDYNPIENYNMLEELEGAETLTREQLDEMIRNLTHGKTGTETETKALSDLLTLNTLDQRTPATTRTETDSLMGFNSNSFVDSDKRVVGETGTETLQRTGTETTGHTGTDTMQHNTQETDTGTENREITGNDSKEYDHTLTRKGNIGVTTTQQMIQQQRELLLHSFLNDIVFPDIDRALTLSVY